MIRKLQEEKDEAEKGIKKKSKGLKKKQRMMKALSKI